MTACLNKTMNLLAEVNMLIIDNIIDNLRKK